MVARFEVDSSGVEEQAVGFQRGIQLVLDHTALHPHPTLLDVDFENAVQVAGQVDHDAVGQRLAVGAGAAAARGEHHGAVLRMGGELRHQFDIRVGFRKHGRLRQTLVNRVVRGEHGPRTQVASDFPLKAFVAQLFEKACIGIGLAVVGGEAGDHSGRFLQADSFLYSLNVCSRLSWHPGETV